MKEVATSVSTATRPDTWLVNVKCLVDTVSILMAKVQEDLDPVLALAQDPDLLVLALVHLQETEEEAEETLALLPATDVQDPVKEDPALALDQGNDLLIQSH